MSPSSTSGKVRVFEVTPEEAGLPRARLEDLKGGTPASNATAVGELLGGAPGAYRDIVLLNAPPRCSSPAASAPFATARRWPPARSTKAPQDPPSSRMLVDRRQSYMSDVLREICADKRDHVAGAKRRRPWRRSSGARPRGAGAARLRRRASQAPSPRGRYGLIAEIKKASPSKGLIRADFDRRRAGPRLCRPAAPPASRC